MENFFLKSRKCSNTGQQSKIKPKRNLCYLLMLASLLKVSCIKKCNCQMKHTHKYTRTYTYICAYMCVCILKSMKNYEKILRKN